LFTRPILERDFAVS